MATQDVNIINQDVSNKNNCFNFLENSKIKDFWANSSTLYTTGT